MPRAEESTLTIKELTGQKRVVTLRGPSLPFQGASWGGQQRVTTTWYPGNASEATQHVLGPTEKESTWDGSFTTTLMLRTPTKFEDPGGAAPQSIVRANTLATLLEDIFRLGQRLRVEWQNTIARSTTLPDGQVITSVLAEETFKVVREGRAAEWDFNYERADDIDWTITFDWLSRGATQQKILTTRTETTVAQVTELVIVAQNVAIELDILIGKLTRERPEDFPTTLSLDDIENFLNGPKDLMADFAQSANRISNRFAKIGELIQQTRTLPVSIANQALDVANNAVAVAGQFVDTIGSRPPELNVANARISQLSKSTEAISDSIDQASSLQDAAIRMKTIVQDASSSNQTILAVHVTRGVVDIPALGLRGEIVNSISSNFYGTPDHAASLLRANNLPLSQLFIERGKVIIIPTLDAIRQFNPQGN